MKPYIALLFMFSGSFVLHAQQLQSAVLAANGGSATIGTMQLDWTLGELAVASYTTRPQSFTEGFHQPMLKVEKAYEITGVAQEVKSSMTEEISIYPNPASDQLLIKWPNAVAGECKINVWTSSGSLLHTSKVIPGTTSLALDIHAYPGGLFFVEILLPSIDSRTIYKISKI